jgi:hypothetical protein
VLIAFVCVVAVFGLATLVHYWPTIRGSSNDIYYAVWLFLTMVGGMFVQVVTANYRSGQQLFHVEASRLVFPLLFSLVVFYPIWSLTADAPRNLFAFHAAFLNGYFWESVVSAAKPPEAGGPRK